MNAADLSDLLEEIQRRLGEFVILSEETQWTIYGPWGVVRDCSLYAACIIALEHMDFVENGPVPFLDHWPDTRGPDAST